MIIILGIIIFLLIVLFLYCYRSSSSKIQKLETEIKKIKQDEIKICKPFITENDTLRKKINKMTDNLDNKNNLLISDNDKLLELAESTFKMIQ